MAEHQGQGLSRRKVIQGGAVLGAGLVLGLEWLPGRRLGAAEAAGAPFEPNAFVRIGLDGTVTVILKHIEFGQGVSTGLPTIVAEELDADWSQMRFEHAPADETRYNNLFFGPVQGTGGSTATANSWQQLRVAGATARAMLVAAAAERWGVPAAEVAVESGRVLHAASGRSAGFGELAEAAALLPVPEGVPLKDPKDFRLIGKRLPRLDSAAKSDGSARFTQDFDLPGMLTAVIARPPRFGATVASFDAAAAGKVPGVVRVVEVPSGVAVVGRGFWAAKKGRDALEVAWDESAAEKRGSAELWTEYRRLAATPGVTAASRGDAEAAIAGAARTFEAEYLFPYLAHAPMETLDCVVQLEGGRCRAWAGSQLQTVDRAVIAGAAGVAQDQVDLTTLFGGGSFGRRATPNGDVAGEAAAIAKAVGGRAPVKLVWTREDDLRGGRYRPMYLHRLRAGLDAAGNIVGWQHRIVGQSIVAGTPFEGLIENGVDATSVEGARNLPYAVPNLHVDLHSPAVGVPVLWWRSVGHTHNAYSTETFLDELAAAAGRDPVELRRSLLADHPRHLAVLELAAERAGWGSPLPAGRARGVAVHESFSSFAAQVAEIRLGDDGLPVVERVVCAVDCGIAVNPDVIAAQMESGIGYGLNAALFQEIELEEGRVVQSNFHDYRPLRIHEMPRVEVHVVPSNADPTGVGEPGVPPIAPAVANAWFALTGKPVRRLPFRRWLREERQGEVRS